jgi:hypothetical protein
MSDNGELIFGSPTPKIIPITIDGKRYELRELDADGWSEWQTRQFSYLESQGAILPDGKVKPTSITPLQPVLVSLCLYFSQENGGRVEEAVLRKWSYQITEPLYKECRKINGMDKEDEAKNSVGATT